MVSGILIHLSIFYSFHYALRIFYHSVFERFTDFLSLSYTTVVSFAFPHGHFFGLLTTKTAALQTLSHSCLVVAKLKKLGRAITFAYYFCPTLAYS